MKTSEILRKAKKLIEKPENWTKGAFAREKSGITVGAEQRHAVSFCSLGALVHAAGSGERRWAAECYLKETIPGYLGITMFNDSDFTTHEDVMEAFKEAIILAEMDGD